MTRAVLNQFASLTNPTLPNLDADFLGVANTLVVPCSASGTNAISLTPLVSTVTVSAYTDKDQYTFNAAATSTGDVTLQVSALGLLNLYKAGGVTQATTGDVVNGQFYQVAYQASLNVGAGGFVIISAIAPVAAGSLQRSVFVSTGTFTTPANTATTTVYKFIVTGAGGSGAAAGAVAQGGGGAGATAIAWFSGLAPTATVAVTVGSGVAGVTATNIGASGANSSVVVLGNTVLAKGGQGGSTVADLPGGHGGLASGGLFNIPGGPGGANGASCASGGASFWGGGGSGLCSGALTAPAATAPGAGGGSAATGAGGSSGAGADGIVVIEWVA